MKIKRAPLSYDERNSDCLRLTSSSIDSKFIKIRIVGDIVQLLFLFKWKSVLTLESFKFIRKRLLFEMTLNDLNK